MFIEEVLGRPLGMRRDPKKNVERKINQCNENLWRAEWCLTVH